jgi:Zn-dependent peptidase ImmA (M78 family)/transcriptional regulator with XRE-family HTH domain
MDAAEVGRRVRAERERRGLSERVLAGLTGCISQPTLHRIETGARDFVTLEELDALAAALGVPMGRLLNDDPLRDRVLAAARASVTNLPAVESAVAAACDLIALEEHLTGVGFGATQRLQLPSVPINGDTADEQGQAMAETLRLQWNLGAAPISDIQELIETKTGVDVASVVLAASVDGICVTEQTAGIAVLLVNCNDRSHQRQRFTLAHELGHLLAGDTTRVEMGDSARSRAELRAHAFARNFLVPAAGVATFSDPSKPVDPETLARLAHFYGVSHDAALVQLHQLGRVTAYQKNRLAGVTAQTGATRYGWYDEWRIEADRAGRPRIPKRLWARAVAAYQGGAIGIGALARLTNDQPAVLAERLQAEGIEPLVPAAVPLNRGALLARAHRRTA